MKKDWQRKGNTKREITYGKSPRVTIRAIETDLRHWEGSKERIEEGGDKQ